MKLNTYLRAILAGVAAAIVAVPVFFAAVQTATQYGQADQGSLCMPTSGTVTGLAFSQNVNAALQALVTANSGATAPVNPCTSTAQTGQFWLDTSTSQPTLRIYDGTVWQPLGTMDASTGIWTPPVGGGAESLVSASTTDLWSLPQNLITVSGTTTITSLATSNAVLGTMKVARFSGALTLTHNATSLILPTGANIATQAGDVALVMSLGGSNAVVVNYQRASGVPVGLSAFVGDSGSGGSIGSVPAPAAGTAATGKVLSAGGDFTGNSVPVGAVVPYAGVTAPGGWLFAYGQAISRTTYADLWAASHVDSTITVTVASPAVVSWTGHPLSVGSPVSFATSGALPTGMSAATTYYVISAGFGSNSFQISTSVGGSAVNTSGTQSGTHTATYAPYGAGNFTTTFNVPDLRGYVAAGRDNMGGTSANRLTGLTGGVDGDVQGAVGGEQAHTLTIAEIPDHQHIVNILNQSKYGANSGGAQAAWSGGDSLAGNANKSVATDLDGGGDGAHNNVPPTIVMNYIIRY